MRRLTVKGINLLFNRCCGFGSGGRCSGTASGGGCSACRMTKSDSMRNMCVFKSKFMNVITVERFKLQ
jgi:hypothetical protein